MLRAAEAEAQAEASRALIGADMGPGVNRTMSPVHACSRPRLHCGGICNNASADISRSVKPQRLHRGCQTKSPWPVVAGQGLENARYQLFPLDGFGSVVPSFQLYLVSRAVSRRVPPNDAASRFVGFGDRSWDSFINALIAAKANVQNIRQRASMARAIRISIGIVVAEYVRWLFF